MMYGKEAPKALELAAIVIPDPVSLEGPEGGRTDNSAIKWDRNTGTNREGRRHMLLTTSPGKGPKSGTPKNIFNDRI